MDRARLNATLLRVDGSVCRCAWHATGH
eukprot:COSAG01_NODE_66193_length_271_cov_0.569767_1_plen_27_part_10